MYVLGELIDLEPEIKRARKLGERGIVRLPIPWYQRAPLGLLTGTTVHVAILHDPSPLQPVEEDGRPRLGDIIVSVVNPWRHVFRVQVKRKEQEGALHSVFDGIGNLFEEYRINIALAETVTTDCRHNHDVTLVCEILNQVDEDTIKEIKIKLESLLKKSMPKEAEKPTVVWQRPIENIAFSRIGVIRNGWVCDCDWFNQIEPLTNINSIASPSLKHQAPETLLIEEIIGGRFNSTGLDCRRVVVYSAQVNRIARFVIPKHNAFTVEIEHADIPGALEKLTSCLAESGLNLLSTLIRRGGAGHGNATLVAVCEPAEHPSANKIQIGRDDWTTNLTGRLREIPNGPMYRIGDPRVSFGKHPSRVLTLRHPEDRIIQVPKRLRDTVKSIRDAIPPHITPAFISRRFAGNDYRSRRLARIVHLTLKKHRFEPIEARPDPLDDNPTTFDQVEARLWACDLGIVLVVSQENVESMSGNLAHEAGFLQGQDKPVVFLVEQHLARQNIIERNLSNIQGHVVLTYADGDSAYDRDHPNSIYQVLSEWLRKVRHRLMEKRYRM